MGYFTDSLGLVLSRKMSVTFNHFQPSNSCRVRISTAAIANREANVYRKICGKTAAKLAW